MWSSRTSGLLIVPSLAVGWADGDPSTQNESEQFGLVFRLLVVIL